MGADALKLCAKAVRIHVWSLLVVAVGLLYIVQADRAHADAAPIVNVLAAITSLQPDGTVEIRVQTDRPDLSWDLLDQGRVNREPGGLIVDFTGRDSFGCERGTFLTQ